MLALTAGKRLVLTDHTSLKILTKSKVREERNTLDIEPTALAWTHDGSGLFLATDGAIRKYDRTGRFERVVCCYQGASSRLLAVMADGSSLFYANGDHAVQVAFTTGETTLASGTLSSPILSISLSNDDTTLAICSKFECVLRNLSDSTQVSLGGFPTDTVTNIRTCTFHSHHCKRLFIGCGRYLLIFDTTVPSRPIKTVKLQERASTRRPLENVECIASSPFSDNLVAVGYSHGLIGLAEIKRGKIIDVVDMKEPIATLAFANDGASLLVKTKNGKLLLQNLRSLRSSQSTRTVIIDEELGAITCFAIQHIPFASPKSGLSPELYTKRTSRNRGRPLSARDTNMNPLASSSSFLSRSTLKPAASNIAPNLGVKSLKSPNNRRSRRRSADTRTPLPKPPRPFERSPQVSDLTASASGSSLDISLHLETLPSPSVQVYRRAATTVSPRSNLRRMVIAAAKENNPKFGSNTPPHGKTKFIRTTKSSVQSVSAFSSQLRASSSTTRSRKETSSTQSGPSSSRSFRSETLAKRSARCRDPTSKFSLGSRDSVSMDGSVLDNSVSVPELSLDELSQEPSSISDVSIDNPRTKKNVRGAQALHEEVCSPDDMDGENWSAAPVNKTFPLPDGKGSENEDAFEPAWTSASEAHEASARHPPLMAPISSYCAPTSSSNALQLTPARVLSICPSPLRNGSPLAPSNPSSGKPFMLPSLSSPASAAKLQDLFRALLKPTLEDLHHEQSVELRGLHLDMLRLGRDVKREIREVVGEAFEGEVAILREENRRLREENERLRQGLLG